MAEKLKVRAVGSALVQDFDRLDDGVRAYVGRKFDASVGGWITAGDVEVSARPEYLRALAEGDLELVTPKKEAAK